MGKAYVQMSNDDLYVSYRGRGGVQGFKYRFDEGPPSEMQIPSDIEKQIGAIKISGAAFQQLLRSSRLRIETLTLISGIANEDINLTGARPLYTRMLRECSR
jgi:hypothetical protein